MALSAQERRLLADVEQRLRTEDPELVHALSTMRPAGDLTRSAGRAWSGLLLTAIAVLLISVGALFGEPDEAPSPPNKPNTGEVIVQTPLLGFP
ncbi:MAG: DUF3040 domain-containing protein [Streptosporangiales bacterium]|nr:DUF3040 domain-containing protein [Streptosporangiales bacterium]